MCKTLIYFEPMKTNKNMRTIEKTLFFLENILKLKSICKDDMNTSYINDMMFALVNELNYWDVLFSDLDEYTSDHSVMNNLLDDLVEFLLCNDFDTVKDAYFGYARWCGERNVDFLIYNIENQS